MHRITLRLPEELAKKIEDYASESKSIPTKQHAYRLFLEQGVDAVMNNANKGQERLAEISATLALENRHYLRQLYRILFDARKSKFEAPESEFESVRMAMKELISSVLANEKDEKNEKQGISEQKDGENNA
ncbi:hypothetical protein [Cysteiniphilum sp. QT6929]|uniref:hypothetical protein n=1 Tax=Cysteiniphilum sp. QT6929 TaxID=2975055 RepID=UPI0024B36E18|nr:hypothetical protein [Cysteiniphilum sp. QT6929]WHN66791.1 hypothetical protein NYP54_11605 [Cysteiniphilum sp. QT6929]